MTVRLAVGVTVPVAVQPVVSIVRERVCEVWKAIPIIIGTAIGANRGGPPFIGATIALEPELVVTVTVPVRVRPLHWIGGELVWRAPVWVVPVTVTVSVRGLARVLGEGVPLESELVVPVTVPVRVSPLSGIVWEDIRPVPVRVVTVTVPVYV